MRFFNGLPHPEEGRRPVSKGSAGLFQQPARRLLDTALKLIALLDRRERLRLALLLGAVIVTAFLQMASIAAVLPFLSVAADPELIGKHHWLAWAYDRLGFSSTNGFLIGLGGAALAAVIVANAWTAATHWAQYRFVHGRTHALSMRLMAHYLGQPYVWFLGRNGADLGKNVLAEVEQVTRQVLQPGLQAASRAVVALAIVVLLLLVDPVLALVVSAVLGAAFAGIWIVVRRKLTRLGEARLAANTQRYSSASEAFGAIKDVKLMGKERAFLTRLREPSARLNRAIAGSQVIAELPRYGLEVVAFGGVLVMAITLLARGGGLHQIIPVLGLYVFAGYRLMPMLQQVFYGVAQLSFGAPALDNLHSELTGGRGPALALGDSPPRPLGLTDRLVLEHVSFTYPGARKPALSDVSLLIEADTTLGIMGPTGAGKTTLVDVILGLLRPGRGRILIDGTALDEDNSRAWQAGLGYVPQHIWLADDTVAANIAFGTAPCDIDGESLERAARLAQLHDFVASELPAGYDTVIGERGVRLSGGQRQRIGIARALYRDPAILVFDEATSALDTGTEAAVMAAVARLSGTRTIILIAHRLTTLAGCDVIYKVDGGRLIGPVGTALPKAQAAAALTAPTNA